MHDFLTSVYQVVRHGMNTNSYKFALLRALVRIAPSVDTASPVITTKQLSPIFVELYWPLEVNFHLRQGIDPDKDPIVMCEIRKLLKKGTIYHGMKLSHFIKTYPKEYAEVVSRTDKNAFNYVLSCFHTVRKAEVKNPLFTHQGDMGKSCGEICLTDDALDFLISNAQLLDFIAIAGWTKFTEAVSSSPKLFSKLSGEQPKRGNLVTWRESLSILQEGKCFYCGVPDPSKPHIDHVIPWSYVLEDRTWNLVLSCDSCNGKKSDRLPSIDLISKLQKRNISLLGGCLEIHNKKFLRDFDEWKTRDLKLHVNALYDQAVGEQYPLWL